MNSDWQTASLVNSYNHTPNFKTLILRPRKFYSFKSGNFVELALKNDGAFKCYSVVSSPKEKGTIEVGIKLYKNGELSPKLFELRSGDKLLMRGPTGAYFVWEPSKKTTILIAGGSGICPMMSILRQYQRKIGQLKIIFSTKKGSVYYSDELKKLCSEKNVEYKVIETGQEARINRDLIEEKFKKLINAKVDYFVAGPTNFVQDVSFWLSDLGVKSDNLRTDDFGA